MNHAADPARFPQDSVVCQAALGADCCLGWGPLPKGCDRRAAAGRGGIHGHGSAQGRLALSPFHERADGEFVEQG